ncbi:hypothetical protein [Allonocardiopsis opalescens]|uniref:Uncharacterized protein n=1 Tax=Allonocardiopsis opalescens TaxID=1144618 RepID=A0A2T0PSS3_9ACTN|nr:hypothetical protein [Allonocardiopsis opalescens]PRX91951.1 hypothetical protein CLV72_11224 [Allonocardiopsis opalescens]
MQNLTREQKAALAQALLAKAGDLIEFWAETIEEEKVLRDVDSDAAAQQLSVWLRRLPGRAWDMRLPLD